MMEKMRATAVQLRAGYLPAKSKGLNSAEVVSILFSANKLILDPGHGQGRYFCVNNCLNQYIRDSTYDKGNILDLILSYGN